MVFFVFSVNLDTMDIKNTKELLVLGSVLVEASIKAQDDGKISLRDLTLLMDVIPKVAPALEDLGKIPAELKDLDQGEIDEIKALVVEMVGHSDLSDAEVIKIAEEFINSAASVLNVVKGIIDLRKA